MSNDDLREYINMVKEEGENDQLYEMANIFPHKHGIPNVVIWAGISSKQHGLRIKVSNIPNKMDANNNFTIMMPSLDYDPKQVAKWIDTKTLNQILEWIKINQPLLYDYETGQLDDTDEFMKRIQKV